MIAVASTRARFAPRQKPRRRRRRQMRIRIAADVEAVYLRPRCAHMHNFAPTPRLVWARLELFVDQLLTLRGTEAESAHS
jgi:hypothetical protein